MVSLVSNHLRQLEELCRKHRVQRLEIFGSAADGTFDAQRSDLDFLVEYLPVKPGEKYDLYFGLLEGLEALFGRKVDLVEPAFLSNPYFIRRVNESRKVVYDA